MKRMISAAALLFIVTALAACKPTPETLVVIQKDMEQMLEKAQGPENIISDEAEAAPALSLAERYDIPESYEYSIKDEQGRYELNVNAKVELPDVVSLPIVRVEAADFTQAQVTGLFNALCGNEAMYYKPNVMSKADIQDMILHYKQIMANEEYSEVQRDAMPGAIEYYESLYASAPEETEWRRCYGELENGILRRGHGPKNGA